MNRNSHRDSFWQFIRGICIAAVVLIHCPTGIGYSDASFYGWFCLRQVINFPVVAFVFMSGYFTSREKVESSASTYLSMRGGRLLIPYVTWSLVYSIAWIVVDILQQEKINYKDYVIRFLTGNASWQLYYILVLMQLVLLTPVIFKLLDKTIWRLILYAITPIHISVVYFLNLSTSQNVGTYATLFSAWILFYLVGLDARAGRLDRLVQNIKFWHVMVSLLFSVSEALLLFHIVGEPASITFSQIRFFNCLYGVVLILWLMKIRENASKINIVQKWWYRIGCTLGDESYGIFFCHIAVLFVVTTLLRIIGFDKVWSVYWLLSWIIILFGSLGLVKMGAFVFRKLNMRWVIMALGLE